MSKATIQAIVDDGFRPEQCGMPSNATAGWNDAGGYLDRALQEAGRWAGSRVGDATYAAVVNPSYAFDCIARAEVCFVRHILFKRRVAFLDSSGTTGMGQRDTQYLDRREMLVHAQSAWECAQENIAEAIRATGGDPSQVIDGVGASFGHIETGMFPQSQPGALNA